MKIKNVQSLNEDADLMEYRTPGSKNKSTLEKEKQAQQSQPQSINDLSAEQKQEVKDAMDDAENILGDDTRMESVYTEGKLERLLDRMLRKNENEIRLGTYDFQNLLVVGPAGSGKTAKIKNWAAHNNINLVTVIASAMDETDLGGILAKDEKDPGTVHKLSSKEFDTLDSKRSVLFLDEWNRAPKSVRAPLLSLIQEHTVRDDRLPSKKRMLKGFLFTVAAINPADENYDTDELDDAEKNRFRTMYVSYDNEEVRQYMHKQLQWKIDNTSDEEIKKEYIGQQRLADTLLSDSRFTFDNNEDHELSKESGNGLLLSSRSLMNALTGSDGTKDDFLDIWSDYCNNLKLPVITDILSNYVDVEDEATNALKGHDTESSLLKKRSNLFGQMKSVASSQ